MSSETFDCVLPAELKFLDLDVWKFQQNEAATTTCRSTSLQLPAASPSESTSESQNWIPSQIPLINSTLYNQTTERNYYLLPTSSTSSPEPVQPSYQCFPSLPNYVSESFKPTSKTRECCECPNCQLRVIKQELKSVKKSHVCHFENCHKTFTKTSHLRSHIRTHTGERPYRCLFEECGKSFIRSDELLRHTRIHTGEKKYSCKICGKKFSRGDHLKKHGVVHIPKASRSRRKASSSKTAKKLDVTSPANVDTPCAMQQQDHENNGHLPTQPTYVENSIPEVKYASYENLTLLTIQTPCEQQLQKPLVYDFVSYLSVQQHPIPIASAPSGVEFFNQQIPNWASIVTNL